jgi:hypothetical protein
MRKRCYCGSYAAPARDGRSPRAAPPAPPLAAPAPSSARPSSGSAVSKTLAIRRGGEREMRRKRKIARLKREERNFILACGRDESPYSRVSQLSAYAAKHIGIK